MSSKLIAELSLIGALLLGALTVIFPAVFFFALITETTGNSILGLEIGLGLFVVSFAVYFVVLFLVGWIFSKIPRRVAYVLIALLLVVGILFLQPEIDFVALFGLIFVFLAGGRTLPALGVKK